MYLTHPIGLVLAILAVSLPLLEIAVMIKVGSAIGFVATLAIIMGTGFLGVWVLQTHGFVMMRRMQETLEAGQPPMVPMIEGFLLFLAAVLLISPGFICDGLGLLLLTPPFRRGLAKLAHDRIWGPAPTEAQAEAEATPKSPRFEDTTDFTERDMRRARGAGPILEGEFERVDDDTSSKGRRPDRKS